MEITGPKIDALVQAKASIDSLIRDFRVGQVLKAVAQSTTAQGLVQLSIGRQTVHARSPLPLPPGTQLTLRVEQAGDQPSFRVLDPPPPAAIKAEALRQVLPRMLELIPALGRALEAGNNPKAAQALPEDVRQLAQALARVIPPAANALTGRGLQNAVSRSGLFTEARMAQGQVPGDDVKTALARLATRLRSTTTPPTDTAAKAQPKADAATGTPARQPAPGAAGQSASQAAGNKAPIDGKPLPAQSADGAKAQAAATPAQPAATAKAQAAATAAQTTATGKPPTADQAAARPTAETAVAAKGSSAAGPGKADIAAGGGRQAGATAQGVEAKPTAAGPPRATAADVLPARAGAPTPPMGGLSRAGPGGAAQPMIQQPLGSSPQGQLSQQPLVGGKPVYPQALSPQPTAQGAAQQAAQPATAEAPAVRLVQELASQVEGALSRIQYNQLSSLPGDDPNRQAWQLDLPLRNGEHLDAFRLRVEEEKHARALEHEGSTWRVDLAFNLDPLGPIRVRIGLQGETVSSVFWAENPETVSLIERRMEVLEQGLERVGLEVGRLSAHRGQPPAKPRHPGEQPESGLLDEQA